MVRKAKTKVRSQRLATLLAEARACNHCAASLPHPPRPVVTAAPSSRIVLIGQAPGAKVHESGVAWDDDSGVHLREWLDVDAATFRDPKSFAIVPMGFCWPGRRAGGDLPPRKECAPLWHDRILAELEHVRLVVLIGQHAIARYALDAKGMTLTATVRRFREYLPGRIAVPHPSWRSRIWIQKNPWFERDLLPALRARVGSVLAAGRSGGAGKRP
jgi:uracil-DNA glycosylase